MRKKLATLAAILVLTIAAIIAGIIWSLPASPRAGPWKLSDGSELSLAGVTYGKHHTMRYGDRVVDYLYPILPNSLRKKFGCKVTTFDTTNANGIVIWFWDKGVATNVTGGYWGIQDPPYCINVADTYGMESDVVDLPKSKVAFRDTNVLHGWELKQLPRRSREMNIRLYRAAFNREKEIFIADFKIPNRVQRGIPAWNPEALPVTRKTTDFEVTLVNFESGGGWGWIRDGKGRTTNYDTWAGVAFTRDQQLIDEGWPIVQASAIAASGETREMWGGGREPGGYDGLSYRIIFKGALWQEEPAWKLKIKVARTTNYPPEELWTVKGVPIPAIGKNVELNYKTNIYGAEIEVFAFGGPGARFKYDSISMSTSASTLYVRSPLPAADMRLEMVEIRDNLGRKVSFRKEIEHSGTGGRGATIRELVQAFALSIPPGAANVDVTVAYTKTVEFEFTAKPTIAKPTEPQ